MVIWVRQSDLVAKASSSSGRFVTVWLRKRLVGNWACAVSGFSSMGFNRRKSQFGRLGGRDFGELRKNLSSLSFIFTVVVILLLGGRFFMICAKTPPSFPQ